MAGDLHIFNRGGVFYWRRRLLGGIAQAFGRQDIVISLRLRDPKAARRLGRILSVEFDQFLLAMQLERRNPTEAETKIILKQLYERIVEGCRDEKMSYYHPNEVPSAALAGSVPRDLNHPLVLEEFEEQSFFMDPVDSARSFRQDRQENRLTPVRWLLKPMLKGMSIDPETDTLAFRRFLDLAIQVSIKAFEQAQAELSGETEIHGLEDFVIEARAATSAFKSVDTVDQAPRSPLHVRPATSEQEQPRTASDSAPPISTFFESFVKQAIDEGVWKKGTEKHNRNSLNLIVRIIGDKPAGSIGRADATTLRRTLERLPNNLGKSSRHAKMTIEDIIARMKPGELTMSESTLDRHWRAILAFIKWLNRQDDVPPTDVDRVFGGFRRGKHVPSETDRNLWDSESLKTLFASPVWTGFTPHPRKRYWRHEPGEVVVKDEYWWLPLLGAYQGARLEELCRLTGEDVCELDGFSCIRFRGEHLKNDGSERDVPIHSAILKLGFLEFAASAGNGRLFPAMLAGGPDAKYGYDYSQYFSEYRKKINVYRRLMDFHSFRHQVTTKILNGGGTILIADDITGHDSEQRKEIKETQSSTMVYFDGYGKKILKDAIETIQYPEIDIERLISLAETAETHTGDLTRRFPRVWGRAET